MKLVAVFLVSIFLNQTAFADCVVESGETTSCQNEQAKVANALSGLIVDQEVKYCRLGYKSAPDNGLLNCRSIITYRDAATGNPNTSVFTDHIFWEVAATATSPITMDGLKVYFLKKANGNYETFIDNSPTSTLDIDSMVVDALGAPLQSDVSVTFTDGLPSFLLIGPNVLTGDLQYLNISYSAEFASVIWAPGTAEEYEQGFDVVY